MKIVTSIDQVTREEQLSWLGKNYAIDVETEGLRYWEQDLIGVALQVNDEAYYFVRKHTADDGVTINNYLTDAELQTLLCPVMAQENVVACLHNAKYDLHFFERFGLPLRSRDFDSLMAAQLLDENRKNGLKELTYLVGEDHSKYETMAVYDTFEKGSPLNVPLEPFAKYAMMDVIITLKLHALFSVQMAKDKWRETSIQDVFNNIWMPLVPVLQEVELKGFKVNREKSRELHEHYSRLNEAHQETVQRAGYEMLAGREPESIAGYYWVKLQPEDEVYENAQGQLVLDQFGIQTPVWRPTTRSMYRKLYFNLNSSDQLVELILRDIELPEGVELEPTKTGQDSVSVDNLKVIKYYYGDKTPYYIDALLEWRKAEKFVNTYLDAFINKTDKYGRLHCFFSMAQNDIGKGGTRTGRLSSSNINLQNIPSRGDIGQEARELFEADEGNVLVVADYSNMETVIATHYSQDPVLMKAFEEGLDVHAITACGQHNIPYDKFMEEYKNGNKEYDAWRRTAKTILFGSAYGMGAKKLQRRLLVENGQEYTLEHCRDLLDTFNDTYSVLTKYKKQVMDFAGLHGFVPTISGRKRRLPLALSRDRSIKSRAERQAFNALIQGSCADILFQAMVPIQSAFKAMGGGLVASVHDELIGELPEQYAQAGAKTMQSLMVDLINPQLRCKLKAEANFGRTWLEAKG